MSELKPGLTLRDTRRAFGLTQGELADHLGLSQSAIARWETGRDEIPPRRWDQLRDLFLNRRDAIHPLIERIARRDQHVSLFHPDGRFIRAQRQLLRECGINASEVDGRYKQEWYGDLGSVVGRLSDRHEAECGPVLFRRYEGDLSVAHKGRTYDRLRIRTTFYEVRFDGYDPLILARADRIGRASGDPALSLSLVRLGDLSA